MRRPSGAGKKALKRCESADNPMVFIAHQPQSKRQRSLHTRTLPSRAGGAFNPSLSFFHIPVCPAPPVSFPEVLLFYLLLSPHYSQAIDDQACLQLWRSVALSSQSKQVLHASQSKQVLHLTPATNCY